jgi:enamine deaminase RidA (YjgF/YER057c/UK114 family)
MVWTLEQPTPHRTNLSSGARWESIVGYSRAVRIGNTIAITGCVAVDDEGNVVGTTPYEQTKFVCEKIIRILHAMNAPVQSLIRTRIFVCDITEWESIGRAHGEVFGAIKPATSMIEISRLIDSAYLIEIEADAILMEEEK